MHSIPGRIDRPAQHPEHVGWQRWIPGLVMLRHYQWSWLRHDLVAGLVMTTMLVPVGIAYAEASGIPGINGLYATIVPLLAYAAFGPSRILVLGPDSALAPIILAVVLPLSAGSDTRAAALGRDDGDRVGRRVRGRGSRASRLHHRTALQADPLRLHERHRADRDAQPDSEAARLLGQGDGPLRQVQGIADKHRVG